MEAIYQKQTNIIEEMNPLLNIQVLVKKIITELGYAYNGDFFTDMVLYFKLDAFAAKHTANKVRYCDFPGHKIIREVRFVWME